jgi:hypothetical protein
MTENLQREMNDKWKRPQQAFCDCGVFAKLTIYGSCQRCGRDVRPLSAKEKG